MTGAAFSRSIKIGEPGFGIAYQQGGFWKPGAPNLLDARMQKRCDILHLLRLERRKGGHAEGWPALLKERSKRISAMVLKDERASQ
jgi:hypothetical protein